MIFEFVIVYRREEDLAIRDVLIERISRVLTDNLNEFDTDVIQRMLQIKFERLPVHPNIDNPSTITRSLLGFTLELPEETASARTVIDEFIDALSATPIEHVVKFEDPLLHQELIQRAEEIFAIEMKLRRVLTVIYLNAYNGEFPYNLLREEAIKLMEVVTETEMRNVCENQFFHLTFKQYIGLNKRPDMTKIQTLVDLIKTSPSYDVLQTEVARLPVEDEDDTVFLASLKQRMGTIDDMRNCVAHNRRPSRKLTDDYLNVRPLLEQALDDFLIRWTVAWQDEIGSLETPWDESAGEAVERAMESAEWNEEEKTITLVDTENPQLSKTVSSREELEYCLDEIAKVAFYANAPREDGEFLYDYDDNNIIVESVLFKYEDRLATFFAAAE